MKTRLVSAVIAVTLVAAIFLMWKSQGLYFICSVATLGCIYEYSRLTFAPLVTPVHLRVVFFLLTTAVYFVTVISDNYAIFMSAMASILFLTMVLMTVEKNEDLHRVLQLQSAGLMGFFYCGIFPAMAVRTLFLDNGSLLLFGLMAIVFAGDTFAYLAGRAFGRNKLLEPVSPKKTIEGSIGGLFGSSLAGLILSLVFFPGSSPVLMVLMALVTGLFAQLGDLFESLLKRIAEVKDSGSIMPGHGGILDRVDGILFAAPLYYVAVRYLV